MRRYNFLLTDNFAMMSAASAIEPLRAANLIAGKELYRFDFFSAEGGVVKASCGGGYETQPLSCLEEPVENLFVVAGSNPFKPAFDTEFAVLRRLDRHGARLGGISGGAVVLARAGLLEQRRFTVHWEHMDAISESFPDLIFERRLFVLDRDRATCAGGVAPLDMMHALIQSDYGLGLATEVSNWFIHTRVRPADDVQKLTESSGAPLHPKVSAAMKLMEDHIGDPLSLTQLSSLCGSSTRQLQRHFQDDLGRSVVQHYLRIRLSKADELLRQSRLTITEVGLATGFANQSSFARAFKQHFGASPRQRRASHTGSGDA